MAMSKLSYQEALDRGICVTPRQLAQYLGVDQGKVLRWIQNGELKGINVSETQRFGGRPRWRIPPDALKEFFQTRGLVYPKCSSCGRQIRKTWSSAAKSDKDGRLRKNWSHERQVLIRAKAMSQHAPSPDTYRFELFLDRACESHFQKTGVRVKPEDVLALPQAEYSPNAAFKGGLVGRPSQQTLPSAQDE
jgi:excisionase family DNA binding protein